MAWMNQEKKALIAAELKKVVPANWKWTLSVRHHSTIVMTIRSAPVDLIAKINEARTEYKAENGHANVNHHNIDRAFTDKAMVEIFSKISAALNSGNHDRSDISTDYFDVGWYVDLQIGQWNKPFIFIREQQKEAA
jgi:hypothetical protein